MLSFKFIFSVVLIASFALFAQSSGEIQLEELQSKFSSIKDLSTDFKQFSGTGSLKNALTGKLFYKRDDKLRIELKETTIITDGKTSWTYNSKNNKVIISNYDKDDPGSMSLRNFIFEYPRNCEVGTEPEKERKDKSLNVLTLKPKNSDLNFSFAKLFYDSDKLIRKVEIIDMNGTLTVVEFSGYRLNQNLPDSKFSFNPPEGSKIIDLR